MSTVTGVTKDGDPFEQIHAEAEIDSGNKTGKFYIDNDQIGNIDFDERYELELDDGNVLSIKITGIEPSESDPAIARFDIL